MQNHHLNKTRITDMMLHGDGIPENGDFLSICKPQNGFSFDLLHFAQVCEVDAAHRLISGNFWLSRLERHEYKLPAYRQRHTNLLPRIA